MADKAKKAAEATEKDAEKSVKAEETPDVTSNASETPSEKDSASKKGSSTTKRTKKSASKDSDKEASGQGASGKASSDKKASGKASKSSTRRKSEKKDTGDEATAQLHAPGSNRWVVPTFVTLALLGVLWMVVFYISSTANIDIPVMSDIGYWNLAIGMGLLAVSLGLTTQWK